MYYILVWSASSFLLASQTAEPWGATAPQGISSYLDNGWSYGSEIFNGIVRISLLHIRFESISAIDTLKKVMVEITFGKNSKFRKRGMCPDWKGKSSVFTEYLDHLDIGKVDFFQDCRKWQSGQCGIGFVPPKRVRCATIFRYRYFRYFGYGIE